jgi:ParB/RepB/Spo0J family partition protein
MVHTAKDQFRAYLIDPRRLPGTLPPLSRKTSPGLGHSEPAGDDATGISPTRPALGTSGVRQAHRQRRLLVSLAESGQQTPIVVVLCAGERERYLVIDGHERIAALEQLGRDTVEATVWAMSETEAVLLERSLRSHPQESALEQDWWLAEMQQRYGYGLEELARRLDRSVSWVAGRLALVELLPESIQQPVREGSLGAQLAMKYLVPTARVNREDCARNVAAGSAGN